MPKQKKSSYNFGITDLMDEASKPISDIKDLERLKSQKNCNIDAQNHGGKTALMNAIESRNNVAIDFLVKNGANLDIRNNSGNTALIEAIISSNEDAIKILIDNKVDISFPSLLGKSPIDFAKSISKKKGDNAIYSMLQSAEERMKDAGEYDMLESHGSNIDSSVVIGESTPETSDISSCVIS